MAGETVTPDAGGETQRSLDIAMLRRSVGQSIGLSEWIRIDQDLIDRFADVTGDHQFIHVDPERSRAETHFGGTIAHGFLALSLLTRLRADALPPIQGVAMGINYGFEKVRFITPIQAGARIRGRFTLNALDDRGPNDIQFTWGVSVDIDGIHKPALVAEWLTRAIIREAPAS